MSSPEPILVGVRRDLKRTRGRWAEVAKNSGVPYHTLIKIAQGTVADPRVSTVQLLVDYFARNPPTALAAASEPAHA